MREQSEVTRPSRCRAAFAATALLCRRKANWRRKMTTIYPTAAQPSVSGMPGGFVRWIGIWTNRLAAHLARREGIKALRELDDRGLRDIGIARSQIESAVYGGANLGRFH
jgi:uncharacterized protein YjiS (DUF1127 family)